MKLVFVHGLGGQDGGALERSFEQATRCAGHELLVLRWASGNLRSAVRENLVRAALETALERNPWRLVADVIANTQMDGQRRWDSALAQVTGATQKLIGSMKFLAEQDEKFSVVGFSLGGKVLMSALRSIGDPGTAMRRAVFAGAAVSGASFARLSPELLLTNRLLNIYSEGDEVLSTLYPIFHGIDGAAGTAPVHTLGIRNVRVETGHLSYGSLAEQIVTLATE